jgi:ABC-2 type transport system ATP-binding protein
MLDISGLTKTYPSGIRALRDVSLAISPGMFGLLGPNGAGKTTLMKIAATLLEPDSGTVTMDGIDLVKEKQAGRRLLGYLPQDFGFYPTLTAEQTLNYLAKLKGVSHRPERIGLIDALLERVNLSAARKQRVGEFSGGMRQRLGIAQALIGQPTLIIVDEPTAGLDPEERVRFHNLLAEIAGTDTVVILSTHIVSDVSNLCNQMAIIRRGEIIASCSPGEAIRKISGSVWEALLDRDRLASLKSRYKVLSSRVFEGELRVRIYAEGQPPGPEFTAVTPSLEDYYFSLNS